jgi:DNA (cytosine-5)-methyltransferase 1
MKVLSLFSGIGAFEKALENIGIEYDLVNYCEIDKFASKSYSLIHGVSEDKNLKDVTKIDTSRLNDIDLITYGFPCQDISLVGKKKGFEDEKGNRTRSGLFFEALRIIEDTKPKVAIAENVKALTSKRYTKEFNMVLESLKNAGYNSYYQILDAKDHGIPQHRERVFIVSIRKDIDTYEFRFPPQFEQVATLFDFLEDDVDEKYYLSDKMMNYITSNNSKYITSDTKSIINKTIASTITTREGNTRCDTSNYICSDLPADANIKFLKVKNDTMRIRKLTPKECFRLMGFDDKDVDVLVENKISNTQLYKMAGNSIVVNVLEHLFSELRKARII